MTSERDALRVAIDRSRTDEERVSALKGLAPSSTQDVLDAVTALAEDATESDGVAYEAGWTLARIHSNRGTLLDDVIWGELFARC